MVRVMVPVTAETTICTRLAYLSREEVILLTPGAAVEVNTDVSVTIVVIAGAVAPV